MPTENGSVNQAKALAVITNQINAGLTLVATEIVAATGNAALVAALTLEQTNLNYQLGLLTDTGVASPLTGFQSFDQTAVNPYWFPK